MLIKSQCRIIAVLLLWQLYVHKIFWSHEVLSAQSTDATVDVPPAPDVINDHQQLAEEAGQGGWDHDQGPQSEHLAL